MSAKGSSGSSLLSSKGELRDREGVWRGEGEGRKGERGGRPSPRPLKREDVVEEEEEGLSVMGRGGRSWLALVGLIVRGRGRFPLFAIDDDDVEGGLTFSSWWTCIFGAFSSFGCTNKCLLNFLLTPLATPFPPPFSPSVCPSSVSTCLPLASSLADAPKLSSSPNSVSIGEGDTGGRPLSARPSERYAEERLRRLEAEALDGAGEGGRARILGTAEEGRGGRG